MKRRLVGNRPVDRGGAVVFVPEAEAVEPGEPSGIEAPSHADLVVSSTSFVGWHAPKVRVDVMSAPHHM